MEHTILRLPQVIVRVGLSRSSIYAAVAKNQFPAPIQLGPRAVGWLEADVNGWLEQRVALRRS